MSALNIVRQPDSIHLLSDGAVYDADGVVRFIRPKTFALPHLRAFIGTRGPDRSTDLIGFALASLHRTFDELVDGIEEGLPEICAACADQLKGAASGRIELMIVGWSSERQSFEAYMIATREADWSAEAGDGIEQLGVGAYALTPIADWLVISPALSEERLREALSDGPRCDSPERFVPEMHGLALLEQQRRIRKGMLPDWQDEDDQHHWVGGFALLSTVTRSGISETVIHDWNDTVGDLIEPESINWSKWWIDRRDARARDVAGATTGLSKLKREMLAKKARKGTLR